MTNARAYKKTALSPLEQRIYFAARNARDGVIALEIIRSWRLTDDRTLLSTISRMTKKGWLIRLRRGYYLVTEPSAQAIKDVFRISTYCFPGYNAFSAALYIHGLADMVPFGIYVATRNESGSKTFGSYTIRAVALKERYGGATSVRGYVVSTIPKTIYDCLTHPELAGGYPAVLKAIHEAKLTDDDREELLRYAEISGSRSFYQRLGYLLDILPRKNTAIKRMIRLCLQKVGPVVHLYGRRSGRFIPKWRIVDNVGKTELLSWWY